MGGIQTVLSFTVLVILILAGYIGYKNYKDCGFNPMCYLRAVNKKWEDLKSGNFTF
jgi:hypothetical protein